MKRLRLIYWAIALALCLFHIIIFIGYTIFCLSTGNQIHSLAVGYWSLNGVAIVLLSASTVVKRKKWQRWIQPLGVVSVIVLAGSLVWYLRDSPPIQNDYSEKDLRVAHSGGYRHLQPFFSEEKAAILKKALTGIAGPETIPRDTDQALIAWNRISEYRAAIDNLNRFQAICDLPDNGTIELDLPFMSFALVRNVADIYSDYVWYQLNNGGATEAIEHLGRLHGVARKGMAGSTLLIHKFLFAAMAQKSMATAYAAIDSKYCGPDHLKILKNNFRPLYPAEYDMTRTLIGEYLFIKSAYNDIRPNNFLAAAQLGCPSNEPQQMLKSYLQRPLFYLLFKPNMTLAVQRQYFDLLIDAETHQPPDYTQARSYLAAHNRAPLQRNMIGWVLNKVGISDFSNYSQKLRYRKVQSDMLACAISKRLKEPMVIQDYYAEGLCRYEEKGQKIRAPGPDGRYDSEDDITLEKPKIFYGKQRNT